MNDIQNARINPLMPTAEPQRFDYNVLGVADPQFTLDMMANTDCSYDAATAALAFWLSHGIIANDRCFEGGFAPRSIRVGKWDAHSSEPQWLITVCTEG